MGLGDPATCVHQFIYDENNSIDENYYQIFYYKCTKIIH